MNLRASVVGGMNFDVMGMADAAADELKLQNRQVLNVTYEELLDDE